MNFLLFDVGATLLFLLGYATVVNLQRRRALPVLAMSRAPRPTGGPARERAQPKPDEAPSESPLEQPVCCREWPRLSAPR